MINPRISAVWSTNKAIAPFCCTPRVQEIYTKAEVNKPYPWYPIVTHRKRIAKHMINSRISANWSTNKPIAPFSCTPRVQEVHTKAEVVHITPGLLDLEVLFNCQA